MRFSLFTRLSIIAIIIIGFFYALPNFLNEKTYINWPTWLPDQKINLGLDLQGGSHLVLEVQLEDVVERAYQSVEDDIRTMLREDRIGYRGLRTTPEGVTLFVYRTDQQPAAQTKLRSELGRTMSIENDNGQFKLSFTEERILELQKQAMVQTLEILRARVDEFGVAEPIIQRQGERRVIVELPGIDDVARAKGIIGRTAQLTFHLVNDDANPFGSPPPGYKVFYEQNANGDATTPHVLKTRPEITGELLSGATASFDGQTGEPAVVITFDGRGTRKFAKLSSESVGKRFAIVLDDVVYSAPVIREPILGGTAQITGSFTPQTAEDLATVLRAGALPAKVQVVEERTIGPSLGQDSVEAGTTALGVGFIAVMILMLVFYGKQGVASCMALMANLFLVLGFMSAFGFTLTLPGMAGILLTLGMAVDANVLIFERIREEVAHGRKLMTAYEMGFRSAFGTILDANITTLIAAIVLFAMGSGPIKGFALTLSVGIVASMFTAVAFTRLILVEALIWQRGRR